MTRPLSPGFAKKLADSSLKPLWTIARDINSDEPRSAEQAEIWRWADFRPLIEATIAEVSVEDAVRRVLIMANPAYGGKPATAGSLNACLQILQPGEVAPPHRHSISAIRLITQAAGGITTVDDAACPMREGDLILTPGWCWHGHHNDSDRGTLSVAPGASAARRPCRLARRGDRRGGRGSDHRSRARCLEALSVSRSPRRAPHGSTR